MAEKTGPKPKFQMLGKSKYVHVLRTKAWDVKNSTCQQVRKFTIAGNIDYKKSLSPEAALALEGCEQCATAVVAEAAIEPADKAAARKEARDEVLERAKGKPKKKVAKEKVVKEKAEPKAKADKPVKVTTPTKTKSGTRSTGTDANAKANALAQFCEDNGWTIGVTVDKKTDHVVVTATNGDAVINAYFIDGKYDVARHATIELGSWSGVLRGAHAVRRQVDKALENRDRPHPEPGKGRSGPRKKKEVDMDEAEANGAEGDAPEDAQKMVPFLQDDDDLTIIDAIKGKMIYWRNGLSGSRDEAWVPSEVGKGKRPKIKIESHPKTARRMVSFLSVSAVNESGEVYGPERTVYLDKIVRVVG